MIEPEIPFRFNEIFPMTSDILKIRKEMTEFKENVKPESSRHSSIHPDSQFEKNCHNSSLMRKSQPAPLIDLKNCQNEGKNNNAKDLNKNNESARQNIKLKDTPNVILTPILRKTVKTLRGNTIYRPPDDIKEYHLNIINDQSAHQSYALSKENRLVLKLQVFKPFHPIMMFAKALSILNLILLFLYIPFEVGFWMFFEKKFNNMLLGIFLVFLLFDAIRKINTGYFTNGILIKSRIDILSNYLRKDALVDFITIFAVFFEYLTQKPEFGNEHSLIKLVKFMIFVKGAQFKQLYDELVQHFKIDIYFKGSLQIIELFVVSIFLAHVTACLWYFSANLSIQFGMDQTWLFMDNKNILNSDWKNQYLYSFYWAVVVMMTVGFGDIVPRNIVEVSFCIIAIFTGCALYAYNLNKIGIILQNIYREENEFKEELRIINNFMERKKIDSGLQARIKEYLRFIWNEKKTEHNAKEMEIIGALSNSLKEELLLESYGGIIKAFPWFYKNFTEKTMKSMVSCIKEIKFVPGDDILFVKMFDILTINEIYR